MRQILNALVGLTLWVGATCGRSETWWVTYEGTAFPEEDPAWTRVHGAIPAERWIEDGALFIDGRASVLIYDYYEMLFDHPVDPQGPDETFMLSWRLKVHQVTGYDDPGISITSDEAGPYEFYRASFRFREDAVHSADDWGHWAPFEPGAFHEYEMHSKDMRSYQLFIDGELALEGDFIEVFGPPRVTWGDGRYGASSLSEWDYVRFGVVPEPSALEVALLLPMLRRQRSRRHVADRGPARCRPAIGIFSWRTRHEKATCNWTGSCWLRGRSSRGQSNRALGPGSRLLHLRRPLLNHP